MKDEDKTIEQLIGELAELRQGPIDKRAEEQLKTHCDHLRQLLEERTVQLNREIAERKQVEEALRESEERYYGLFKHSLNGFALHEVVTDDEGHPTDYVFLEVNRVFEELTGLRADDIIGKRVTEVLPGIETDPFIEAYGRVALTGESVRFEQFSTSLNRYYDIAAFSPCKGQFAIIVSDITERVQAEREILRRATQQEALSAIIAASTAVSSLPALLENAIDHILRALELEVGATWVADERAVRNLPAEVYQAMDQVAQKNSLDISRPEIVEDWQSESAISSWATLAPIMARFGIRASITVPLLVEGRHIGGLSVATLEPRRWSCEEIALAEAIGRQLGEAAERFRLLARVREQAQRMQQIVDTVPEGVLLLDATEQIVLANPAAEKALFVLADAQVGDRLTHLGDRSLVELLTSPPRGLWHEVTADGRGFQVIARSIETSPTPGGWVLVIRDVTKQREIEQRIQHQERLAAVGQLAAGIAHDFNNIMATIVLYAHMTAREKGLPGHVRERMETINQQAEHATQLIQQILDFGRRAVLERRPIDLFPLLKEQVNLLKRTLPESIKIELVCRPDQYTVKADLTRMQQMVTNLALNARDAMPEGGILRIELQRIEVKPGESPLLPEMEAGEWVQVTVSDTGTGIRPGVLPHIFNPFFTTKEPGKGSGLGLPQVYGIVGQHGGRIDVETQLDQGTSFTIYLPALSAHPPERFTIVSLEDRPPLAQGRGETILVVEDNASVRKVLAESLKLLNYKVLEAMNGQEALAVLEQHKEEVVLILSDVVMPEMGGIALLHALRERGLEVGMVMLTGHLLERQLEDLRAQGMIDWLPKPPKLEQLAEVVARALGVDWQTRLGVLK